MGISGSQKAIMYNIAGLARAGATRAGYHSAKTFITIGGITQRIRHFTLSITDALDEVPNRCQFVVDGWTAQKGQAVIATQGSIYNHERMFAGHILEPEYGYDADNPANPHTTLSCIDYTWRANKLRVTKRYTNHTGTAIIRDLIALIAADGFSDLCVAGDLGVLDSITFTNDELNDCITRVMKRLGGYWYWDYHKVCHAWVGTEPYVSNPAPLTAASGGLMRELRYRVDLTQAITRVYVEGRGTRLLGAVASGDTMIPVETVDMFEASGEFLKVSFQGSEGGAQHHTFGAVVTGGGGSLIGLGFTPSAALVAVLAGGSGVDSGTHQWAYTFATPSGETTPSPLTTKATGTISPPSRPPSIPGRTDGSLDQFSAYGYAVTFVNAAGETTPGPRTVAWTLDSAQDGFVLDNIEIGPPGTTARKIYRTEGQPDTDLASTAQLKLAVTLNDNLSTGTFDTVSDASLGANAPTTNTAQGNQFSLTGIAAGPSGVTARKVYRTAAGGSQLKLLTTINDNSTTSYTDSTADASLGANAPTGDTSALRATAQNGEAFYTTVTGFATNGAATNANTASPSFTSATYTFVAADVGAYLYIKAGTNWTVGRYLIVSVSAGAAILNGACASVASPTSGTWGVDYSTLSEPRLTFTDLVINASFNDRFSSAANPVGDNFIGNVIAIRDGVFFIRQRAIITGRSGTAALCDVALGTVTAAGGIGALGGAAAAVSVAAGSTSLLLASAGAFSTTGGWAVIGNGEQVIRYTGISSNRLTGIPSSGIGAISAAIGYGSTATVPPMLTNIPASGTGSIERALSAGDEVYLVVQRDDVVAQTALAALIGDGEDGVREDWEQDRRLSVGEAKARGDAILALRAYAEVSVSYVTRDKTTKAGRTITVLGYSNAVLADLPEGYWRLGELSGTVAFDVSGHERHGTYSGDPLLGEAGALENDRDTAVIFDGTNDYVDMGDTTAFEFTGAFSVTFWIKKSGNPIADQFLVSKYTPAGSNFGWRVFMNTAGQIQFLIRNAAGTDNAFLVATGNVTDGQWHHIVCTWDGTTNANGAMIYVDGAATSATATTAAVSTTNDAFLIAQRSGGTNLFAGWLDDVAMYASGLSASQIAAHRSALRMPLSGEFKIQEAQWSDFSADGKTFPMCHVQASSTKFSFEDLLRLARRSY